MAAASPVARGVTRPLEVVLARNLGDLWLRRSVRAPLRSRKTLQERSGGQNSWSKMPSPEGGGLTPARRGSTSSGLLRAGRRGGTPRHLSEAFAVAGGAIPKGGKTRRSQAASPRDGCRQPATRHRVMRSPIRAIAPIRRGKFRPSPSVSILFGLFHHHHHGLLPPSPILVFLHHHPDGL